MDATAVIGLIPAAGHARRLGPLPCSKEILPISTRSKTGPKVACEYLLEHMRVGGIDQALIVLREGKWDIPACLGGGERVGVNLAYAITRVPYGVPYTLDQAYPFVRDRRVALGFPDILFNAENAFARLLAAHATTAADVMLGLFPTDAPHTADMVERQDERVTGIVVKPPVSALRDTWGIAVWSPRFSRFMHDYLATQLPHAEHRAELHVGHVIQAAIEAGLAVRGVRVSEEPFLDIGIPQNLAIATSGKGAWGDLLRE